jgi:Ca-activated chloride channel family protein
MHPLRGVRTFTPALRISALALLLLAAHLFVSSGSAQNRKLPPPPPGPIFKPKPTPTPAPTPEPVYEVLKISSNLVVVPVSVTDAGGQPVVGLKQDDFRLVEEGRPQQISQIGDPGQVPLDIALLIDVSSSVTEKFGFEEQAATRFLREVLRPADSATIYAIDRAPRLEQERASAAVAAAKLLSIRAATGPSPTAFYDTIIQAARYLATNTPEQHRRVVLVISDGEDNFSNRVRDSALAAYRATETEDGSSAAARQRIRAASEAALQEGHRQAQAEVLRDVQTANAVFYSINPSGPGYKLNVISTRAQDAMVRLANSTGGSAFVPDGSEQLTTVFNTIAAELRAQYLLQYYSDDKSSGTSFRHIVITIPARPQLRVRARDGYYPKAR